MTSQTQPLCPRCGQLDAVRNVRSIVTEGISIGQYQSVAPLQWQGKTYYLPAQRKLTSTTLLARRLTAPSQPKKPKKSDFSYMKYASSSFKMKSYLPAFPLGLGLFVVSCAAAAAVGMPLDTGSRWLIALIVWVAVAVIGSVLLSFIMVLFGQLIPPLGRYFLDVYGAGPIKAINQARVTKSAEVFRLQAKADEEYRRAQRRFEKWPEALQRWSKLYYCSRDDVVFLPGTTEFAYLDEMHRLVFSEIIAQPQAPAHYNSPYAGNGD